MAEGAWERQFPREGEAEERGLARAHSQGIPASWMVTPQRQSSWALSAGLVDPPCSCYSGMLLAVLVSAPSRCRQHQEQAKGMGWNAAPQLLRWSPRRCLKVEVSGIWRAAQARSLRLPTRPTRPPPPFAFLLTPVTLPFFVPKTPSVAMLVHSIVRPWLGRPTVRRQLLLSKI